MRIHAARFTGILLLLVLMLSAVTLKLVRSTPAAPDPQVQAAQRQLHLEKLDLERRHLARDANLRFYSKVGLIAVFSLSLLILACGATCVFVTRASVFTYRIGQYNEVVVHGRDLSLAAPVALGLMNAEQLKQSNAGMGKAMELYCTMADVQTRQLRELMKGKTHPLPMPALIPTLSDKSDVSDVSDVSDLSDPPTFRTLVERGDLAPGKPMILGYENGMPRRGSFLDIYSAAVAGESGSGKTATLLFLIGSALVSMPVRFFGIDPHYPHPKSLGFKTKPLWQAGLMTMTTYKDEMLKMLKEIDRIIQHRLKQVDTDTTPVVLVIDELAFLSTTSMGPALANTMERISMEGRKCAVYMLASSQTWLTAKTGGSSSVRDTLTSAYVHRIKPKQANLLLQDKEEAQKVKRQVKHAGEALLVPVGEESVVVKMPFTTEADMGMIATMVLSDTSDTSDISDVSDLEAHSATRNPQSEIPILPALPERVKDLMREKQLSYRAIHKETGIALSTLSNFLNGKGNLTSEQIDALLAYLDQRQPNVTPSVTLNHVS